MGEGSEVVIGDPSAELDRLAALAKDKLRSLSDEVRGKKVDRRIPMEDRAISNLHFVNEVRSDPSIEPYLKTTGKRVNLIHFLLGGSGVYANSEGVYYYVGGASNTPHRVDTSKVSESGNRGEPWVQRLANTPRAQLVEKFERTIK